MKPFWAGLEDLAKTQIHMQSIAYLVFTYIFDPFVAKDLKKGFYCLKLPLHRIQNLIVEQKSRASRLRPILHRLTALARSPACTLVVGEAGNSRIDLTKSRCSPCTYFFRPAC